MLSITINSLTMVYKALAKTCYALVQLCEYRKILIRFFRDQAYHCPKLLSLDLPSVQKQGIRALVVDFDGVLSAHDGPTPLREVLPWLADAVALFGDKVFIFSNTPTQARVDYFKQHYPKITFLRPARSKPYPDGMKQVLAQTQLKPDEILMLDDRLLTGILMAIITGTQAKLITQPYIDWRAHFFKETFFYLLRRVEKGLLKMVLLF